MVWIVSARWGHVSQPVDDLGGRLDLVHTSQAVPPLAVAMSSEGPQVPGTAGMALNSASDSGFGGR